MIPLLIVGGYALAWFVCARALLTQMETNEPSHDTEERVLNAALACLTAVIWPAFGPLLLVMKTRRRTPREIEQSLTERSRELDARARRIAVLERDLGIR